MNDDPIYVRLVLRIARAHGGVYYLRRRFREPRFGLKTMLDHRYDACQKLVWQGRAAWLGNTGPGIRLIRDGER